MAYTTNEFETRSKEIITWLLKEYATVRTGRATPALLDGIQVESYGARVPLSQAGSVGVEDPRTIRVSAWDAGMVKVIEKAIIDADLGVSVVTDEKGLRVIFPELTSERRVQLLKIAKTKLEDARVSVRKARDDVMKNIEKDDMAEDEKFRAKENLQKQVDKTNAELNSLLEKKEIEIQN